MKVSYSKLLVQGVIATALLMSMSCQKKGSARGVQPNTVTKAGAPTAGDENKNVQDPSLKDVPGTKDQTVVTSGDRTKVEPQVLPQADSPEVDAEKVATTSSADKTTAAPVATKKSADADKKTEKATAPAVETKTVEVKAAAPKACSEVIVKNDAQLKTLEAKIIEVDKLSSTLEKDRIANYTTYHQLCLDWAKAFETEKIESCEADGKNRAVNSKSVSCIKYALALKDLTGKENTISANVTKARNERMAQLRAAKLVVSDEAKEMFAKENTSWKMFIVDGELQTDSAKLVDALKANKVACTIAVPAQDKYTHAQNVIVNITAATELIATDEADPVQKGVELAIRMKASDKNATAEEAAKATEEKSVMLCSNLDSKNMNTAGLQKALGKHIAVAAAVAPTEKTEKADKEDKEEKTEEKTEEKVVKNK